VTHSFAGVVDHTFLQDENQPQDSIKKLCQQAHEYGAYAVCVRSEWAEFTRECIASLNATTKLAVTVGFPDGDLLSYEKKLEEMRRASRFVDEYDLVIPVNALIAGRYTQVYEHVRNLCAGASAKCVKMILETSLLNLEQKKKACDLVCEAFAKENLPQAMLKTSTGFGKGGATVEDMQVFSQYLSDRVGIKASGGISDSARAQELYAATGLADLNPLSFRIGSSRLLLGA
jgi:deoxyribose-phosphate aldolase